MVDVEKVEKVENDKKEDFELVHRYYACPSHGIL